MIAKCIYIKSLNRLAFFVEKSDVIQFADPDTGEILSETLHVEIIQPQKRNDGINPPECNASFSMLLDILYIDGDKYEMLVASSNDGRVRMYKQTNKGFVPADNSNQRDNELNLRFAQIIIVW